MNDSKYGYDAKDNVLRISLLRSPIWPDPNADMGEHDFTYSLYPHAGDWREANTVERAYELNDPVVVTTTTAHAGTLSSQQSFFSISPSTALISAVKKAQDDDSIIVRFYEWAGKKTDVKLTVPAGFTVASETNSLEEEDKPLAIANGVVTIPTGAYEIKTVRLKKK
jgi:alpha-mannosidase